MMKLVSIGFILISVRPSVFCISTPAFPSRASLKSCHYFVSKVMLFGTCQYHKAPWTQLEETEYQSTEEDTVGARDISYKTQNIKSLSGA